MSTINTSLFPSIKSIGRISGHETRALGYQFRQRFEPGGFKDLVSPQRSANATTKPVFEFNGY